MIPSLRDICASTVFHTWESHQAKLFDKSTLETCNENILVGLWDLLKCQAPQRSLHVRHFMEQIEKKQASLLPGCKKAAAHFITLTKSFSSRLKQAQWDFKGRLLISAEEFLQLEATLEKKWEEEALIKVWSAPEKGLAYAFLEAGAFGGNVIPSSSTEIRNWLKDDCNASFIHSIVTLDWEHLGIRRCPPEVSQFIGLESINLSGNKLLDFSINLSPCTKLKKLILSYNFLRTFSCDFSKLSELKVLELEFNKLTRFQCKFPENSKLKSLILNNNRIENFSFDFSNFAEFKKLSLEHNKLTEFCCNFSGCTKLEALFLNHNRLTEFLQDFSECPKLMHLTLEHNRLVHFSGNFSGCTQLDALKLEYNKLEKADCDLTGCTFRSDFSGSKSASNL